MSDYLLSVIRTVVPVVIGSALGWLATHGLSLDTETQAGLIAILTAACIAGYYALIRKLEVRWPAVGQWLLGAGVGKTPVYAPADSTVKVDGVTKRAAVPDVTDMPPRLTMEH